MRLRFTSASTLAMLMALGAASAFAAPTPQDFIKDAIQGDTSEIMLGQFATEKSGNPRVEAFGRMLIADHGKAKNEAIAVAGKLGVTPPDQPSAEAIDEHEKLSKLSGGAFDREFADFMVKDHQKVIKEFQDEAKSNQGPASDLAETQLPTLTKHQDMAEAIVKEVGKEAAATPELKESPDQWRASKLVGVAIYGPDDKKIGAISDVLLDKDGKADKIIIGVGGFLGIGEKDISVAFDSVKFTDKPIAKPATDTSSPLGTLGATTSTTDPAVVAGTHKSGAYPDHGMIDMTAAELKQAPAFHFAS